MLRFDGPALDLQGPGGPTPAIAASSANRRRRAVPSCAEAGVLGALAGRRVVQAIEVIKELLGIGDSLAGNLLIYDALNTSFHKVRVKPDPECPLCGSHPSITDLSAHEAPS